jgi:hypothetical protein
VDNKGYDEKMTNGSKASEKQSCGRGECSHAKSVILWAFMGVYNLLLLTKSINML